jgi:hypothetical protein
VARAGHGLDDLEFAQRQRLVSAKRGLAVQRVEALVAKRRLAAQALQGRRLAAVVAALRDLVLVCAMTEVIFEVFNVTECAISKLRSVNETIIRLNSKKIWVIGLALIEANESG